MRFVFINVTLVKIKAMPICVAGRNEDVAVHVSALFKKLTDFVDRCDPLARERLSNFAREQRLPLRICER